MALACSIKLEHTGLDITIPVYISVQDVTLRRWINRATGRLWWSASARVLAHASRDAKMADLAPLETSAVECEFDPAEVDPLTAIYRTLKQVPRFASATDA